MQAQWYEDYALASHVWRGHTRNREPIILSWSGGKDSCMALAELSKDARWQVIALITTVTAEYDRVSMHGVRRSLLEQQAAALELPVAIVTIPAHVSNKVYQARMEDVIRDYVQTGVGHIAFADLFLRDVRQYRETWLGPLGITSVFPLWLRPTSELARSFVDGGFRAILTCVDGRVLDQSFVGRPYDHRLLSELPAGVDPCGENGEFHTFVHDGPFFRHSVPVVTGQIVKREHWFFCDLLPVESVVSGSPD